MRGMWPHQHSGFTRCVLCRCVFATVAAAHSLRAVEFEPPAPQLPMKRPAHEPSSWQQDPRQSPPLQQPTQAPLQLPQQPVALGSEADHGEDQTSQCNQQ